MTVTGLTVLVLVLALLIIIVWTEVYCFNCFNCFTLSQNYKQIRACRAGGGAGPLLFTQPYHLMSHDAAMGANMAFDDELLELQFDNIDSHQTGAGRHNHNTLYNYKTPNLRLSQLLHIELRRNFPSQSAIVMIFFLVKHEKSLFHSNFNNLF